MFSKLEKVEGFVNSLERNQLSEKQQITLSVNPEDVMGGANMNKNGCMNNSSTCISSTNKKDCMNGSSNCTDTINKKDCTCNVVANVSIALR